MQTISRLLTAACALLLPFAANATGHWYLGGNIGQATTDVDDGTVNARLADEGLTGSASVSDTSRSGWRLFGGYAFNPYLDLEAGYTQLGDIGMTLSGTGPLSDAQLKAIRPASGAGFELAALGKYPFTDRLSGFVRAGLFHWEQQYDLSGGNSGSFSGDDAVIGLGAEWRLNDRWSTRLSWDRYTVAQDETTFLAVGLTYRFAADAAAPVAATEPEPQPQPVVAVAESEPVVEAPPAVESPAPAPMEQTPPEPQRWMVKFAFKRTNTAGHESALDEMAAYLAAHPSARVQVTGHTDDSGAEGYNPYLSRLRAQAVADALATRGVDRARITVEGKGASEPIADNKTRAGRAQNRRAEIVIRDEAETP